MPKTTNKYKWSQSNENREINRNMIDGLIGMKECTLLTNKKFKCEELKGYSLIKGKESFCHNPAFVNCPAYNQYLNYEVKRNRRNIRGESPNKNLNN